MLNLVQASSLSKPTILVRVTLARGDRLVQFSNAYNLLISNIFFESHPERVYIWISTANNKERIIGSQIDYKNVMKYKNYAKSDVNSDHNMVAVNIRMKHNA